MCSCLVLHYSGSGAVYVLRQSQDAWGLSSCNARSVVRQQSKRLLGAYLQQAQLLFHHPKPLA